MDLYEAMQEAGKFTHIVRMRKNTLYTFGGTRLPYICVSPSPKDEGDILIRRGEVSAERPKILLPGKDHALEGFDLGEGEDDEVMKILLARQINIPPAKYVNTSEATTTERSTLDDGVERVVNKLDQVNDIRTGVFTAPDAVWNLAVLLYVSSQVVRSAPSNIAEHMEHLHRQGLM